MEYKKGDKFIIEIEDVYHSYNYVNPIVLYKIKGFNSLVFDDNGLDKLEEYEQETLKVGDEVFMKKPHAFGVITKITDEKAFAITKDGVPYMSHYKKSGTCYKTGLHFDKIGDYLEV